MFEPLIQIIENNFFFHPNKNQLRDIERLIHEIIRRENISLLDIIASLKTSPNLDKLTGKNKFIVIKDLLIKRRFPITSKNEKIDTKNVYLSNLRPPLTDNWQVKSEFRPLKVFVEESVKDSYLVNNFRKNFPDIEIEKLACYSSYLKIKKFTISQLKKPLVFIINEKWDFIKSCPCTKDHLRCGYWIFNLGFGCPYDCSYCFLQKYTNFPGIILPANLDTFFTKLDTFIKDLKKPIRIGTGEYCDSLALDHITEYSTKLIPYFKEKNLLFELKTKSANIENILKIPPSPNIVISWSLNPAAISNNEELGAPSTNQRLEAARKIQDKGYKIAFHFDPIIYSKNWQELYSEVITKIYSQIKPPLAWISLGTLRSNRELKTAVELRFPQSNIFYGELLLGEDKKLRYPEFLRKEIYKTMIQEIHKHDKKTPIYLCMETKEIWQEVLGKSNACEIESSLIPCPPLSF
ncbi:MAG: spore photoproduct lyase family protein [Candidatus Omnitrophota bacterium]|nr:hypothetical protein [Candidatus Omnitrophota bacterium]